MQNYEPAASKHGKRQEDGKSSIHEQIARQNNTGRSKKRKSTGKKKKRAWGGKHTYGPFSVFWRQKVK